MPRKRPETRLNKISKMLIEEYQPETVRDLHEDLKELIKDLKTVYKASAEKLILSNLDIFEGKWRKNIQCV